MTEPVRVLHIITDLSLGGAERMLERLLRATDRGRFIPQVISLTGTGVIGERIASLGIPVRSLALSPSLPNPFAVPRLARWIRSSEPDVIQTWMYHADLVGGIAARLAGRAPVAWGLRHTTLDRETSKRRTIVVSRICARLSSRLPKRIVCCSQATRRVHAAIGYDESRMVVIPNGFDLRDFRPDPKARIDVRNELGLSEESILIAGIARYHPAKDHRNLLQAAALIAREHPLAHFILCGDGIDWSNEELVRLVDAAGVKDRVHLLGPRDDVPRLLSSVDIATSSSLTEAFPQVIGEAMATGVVCAATDVGDSAEIIGDTGRIAPPRDPEALARGLAELIEIGHEARRRLGEAARMRIRDRYEIGNIAEEYANLYEEMARR